MQEIEAILKQAQKILSCPVCQRKYRLSEIKLRGFFENVYILNIICDKSHFPLAMTVIIHSLAKDRGHLGAASDQKMINNYQDQLNQFDGDFTKLWNQSD